jgi:hypothetical protein
MALPAVYGRAVATTPRAAQAAGVQGLDQEVVACLRIEQIVEGEVHGRASERAEWLRC